MKITPQAKGEITEDGRLVVEIPQDVPHAPVFVAFEPIGGDDLHLTEDDLRGAGHTAKEIASAPEVGSWDIGQVGPKGADYVESVRRARPR
jgi:hypothetical protein